MKEELAVCVWPKSGWPQEISNSIGTLRDRFSLQIFLGLMHFLLSSLSDKAYPFSFVSSVLSK